MMKYPHRQELLLSEDHVRQLEDLRRSATGPTVPGRQQILRQLIEQAHARLRGQREAT